MATAFSVWKYAPTEKLNTTSLIDLTGLKKIHLNHNWNDTLETVSSFCKTIKEKHNSINLQLKDSIQDWLDQKSFDFKRDPTKMEKSSRAIFGGLALDDPRRANKKTYGIKNSDFIGFMDNSIL